MSLSTRGLIRYAYQVAEESPDPSSHVGAVLVDKAGLVTLASACNDLPTGLVRYDDNGDRIDSADKAQWMAHAERSVINQAAYHGIRTKGLTMVAPWACCVECGHAIIQAGIAKLVVHAEALDRTPERWRASIRTAHAQLKEAGVEIDVYEGLIGNCVSRIGGKSWHP